MKTHYRATLQAGHEVATSRKAASQVMEVTSTRTFTHAWAVSVHKTWPAGKSFHYVAGGFAGSKALAEKAAAGAAAGAHNITKGTFTVLWAEVLPLEVVG